MAAGWPANPPPAPKWYDVLVPIHDHSMEAERRCAGAVILRGYKDLVGSSVSAEDKIEALNWFLSNRTERGSFLSWCRLLEIDPSRYRNQLRTVGLLPCERTARSDHRLGRWLRRFLRRNLKRRAKDWDQAAHQTASNGLLNSVEMPAAAMSAGPLPRAS